MKLAILACAAILVARVQDPPPAPGGVSAAPTSTAGEIQITWSAVSQVDGYNIYRAAVSGGPFTLKVNATLLTTADPYVDTGLNAGTQYFYVVRSQRTGTPNVESSDSSVVNAVPAGTDTTAPAAPVITSQARKTKDTTPTTQGTAEPGTTVFVYSGESELGSTTVAMSGTWSFTPSASLGTDGTYLIRAKADDGPNESAFSAGINVVLDTTAPEAPTNTRTTSFHNCVDVEWTASVSLDVAGYKVERKTGSGSWTLLHSNLVLGTKYRDSTAANGTAYLYRVIAVDDALEN